MKAIVTPIKETKGMEFPEFMDARNIISRLRRDFKENPEMQVYTHVDKKHMVSVTSEDFLTYSEEVLVLMLENEMSNKHNSRERSLYYPSKYAFCSFMLKKDKKAYGVKRTVPAGTVMLCVGKIYDTAYNTKDTQSVLVFTDGKETVLCKEEDVKNTWRTCKVNLLEIFPDTKTMQYVNTTAHIPNIISKAPVYKGRRMYSIAQTYIDNTPYYILTDEKDAVLCNRQQFETCEDIITAQLV